MWSAVCLPVPVFTGAVTRAGIRQCRFHDLRHTFATDLLLGGVDLVTVKELIGHADISMTMRYAHPTPESKREAVELLMKTDQVADVVADEGKVAEAVNTHVVEKNGAGERNRTVDLRITNANEDEREDD